jgi:hypothetical protein
MSFNKTSGGKGYGEIYSLDEYYQSLAPKDQQRREEERKRMEREKSENRENRNETNRRSQESNVNRNFAQLRHQELERRIGNYKMKGGNSNQDIDRLRERVNEYKNQM